VAVLRQDGALGTRVPLEAEEGAGACRTIRAGTCPKLKEENVYAHLNDDKEHDAWTWVLDTGMTNHMSG
jgi:hypothetical protein